MFHPRNRHQGRYDFDALVASSPGLAAHIRPNAYGDPSVDFADPAAVKALNRALLKAWYGLTYWDIPDDRLCPALPGRADYVHYAADLLAETNGGKVPAGPRVRALDIGVGANAVYPLIGHGEYGWSFVGADTDRTALESALRIVACNPGLIDRIALRPQQRRDHLLRGVVGDDERFDITFCNPPFHTSADEAAAGSMRKWRNLGKPAGGKTPALNFGGCPEELWCPGGEVAFVVRLIGESAAMPHAANWFTSLVAKSEHLPPILDAVRRSGAAAHRVVEMAQGAKKSRFVAWRFRR